MQKSVALVLAAVAGDLAWASDSAHHLDLWGSITAGLGLDASLSPVIGSLFVTLLILTLGLIFRSACERKERAAKMNPLELKPEGRVGLVFWVENICDFVTNLTKEQTGKKWESFLPLLATLFIFVLFANLSGLFPGIVPPTQNFSINLGLSLPVFFLYHAAGIREHGLHYAKQFMGPIALLVPLFVCLELISHFARPLSLSFRLQANIFGDHLLLGVFSSMVPVVLPAVLLLFGLLVACIQSFVFTMLTAIYISMAISHDH